VESERERSGKVAHAAGGIAALDISGSGGEEDGGGDGVRDGAEEADVDDAAAVEGDALEEAAAEGEAAADAAAEEEASPDEES